MAIFNSYVKLPEGTLKNHRFLHSTNALCFSVFVVLAVARSTGRTPEHCGPLATIVVKAKTVWF